MKAMSSELSLSLRRDGVKQTKQYKNKYNLIVKHVETQWFPDSDLMSMQAASLFYLSLHLGEVILLSTS